MFPRSLNVLWQISHAKVPEADADPEVEDDAYAEAEADEGGGGGGSGGVGRAGVARVAAVDGERAEEAEEEFGAGGVGTLRRKGMDMELGRWEPRPLDPRESSADRELLTGCISDSAAEALEGRDEAEFEELEFEDSDMEA